jgi:hypothetical protein
MGNRPRCSHRRNTSSLGMKHRGILATRTDELSFFSQQPPPFFHLQPSVEELRRRCCPSEHSGHATALRPKSAPNGPRSRLQRLRKLLRSRTPPPGATLLQRRPTPSRTWEGCTRQGPRHRLTARAPTPPGPRTASPRIELLCRSKHPARRASAARFATMRSPNDVLLHIESTRQGTLPPSRRLRRLGAATIAGPWEARCEGRGKP